MSIMYYHPLGDKSEEITRSSSTYTTYSGHGIGNLDIPYPTGTPLYAMCDGEVTACGRWSDVRDGTTYCVLSCPASANGLGETFYIRYLHGDYTVSKGDTVTAGQQIGTVNMHGNATGPHLHIDFSTVDTGSRDPAVQGTLKKENNKHYFVYKEKSLLLSEDIDYDLIESWRVKAGYSNSEIGYCWLVMASKFEKKTASDLVSSSLKVTLDNDTVEMFVGLTATECSWANAAVAQGVLTVCRNWIYMDSNNTLKRTNLQFTQSDINSKNAIAEHFAYFITGKVDWGLLDRYKNNYTSYFNRTVPGTSLTSKQFVKQFMEEGSHWPYITEAINSGKAQLHSSCQLKDTEDGVMFPSSSSDSSRLMLLPPFGDWILKWGTQGKEGSLPKPSTLLGL